MKSTWKVSLSGLLAGVVLSGLTACGGDITTGGQFVGQRCYADQDCAQGLVCNAQRVCVSTTGLPTLTPDMSLPDMSLPDMSPPDMSLPDMSLPPDMSRPDMRPDMPLDCGQFGDPYCFDERSVGICGGSSLQSCPEDSLCFGGECRELPPQCKEGERLCESERATYVCEVSPDGSTYRLERCESDERCQRGFCGRATMPTCPVGDRYCTGERSLEICRDGSEYESQRCVGDTRCEEGQCVTQCIDRDGDGSFANCEPRDCDDRDPNRSPNFREICGDGIDNDCDGQIDEGCPPVLNECCTGASACADSQTCRDCQCVNFDPFECQFDGQPCENLDSFVNNYYCLSLSGFSQGVCVGLCDNTLPNPSSFCPEPNQACVFGAEQGAGICFDRCDKGDNCGSPNAGCFLFDDPASMLSGVCTPANPANQLGDPCDSFEFFSCKGGSVCADITGNGQGICAESCRPFANTNGSDCSPGSYCLAYDDSFGVCTPDSGLEELDACTELYSSCGEDAVTCYPTVAGGLRCRRTCRLSQGDLDCPGQRCFDVNQGQDVGIGVCLPRGL